MHDKRLWSAMFSGKLHPKGWVFVIPGAILSSLFLVFHVWMGFWLCLLITLFVTFFFRDPDRITPEAVQGAVVAPADGIILDIDHNISLPPELGEEDEELYHRISIFLSIFNVHVNRAPVAGEVIRKFYKAGRFLNAASPEASASNESCGILIETPEGHWVASVQIAGAIARRIVCEVSKNQPVQLGQRYGIICFGSRMDIYLPSTAEVWAEKYQKTVAGESILGCLPK
ncbi:MAG: phosphatidylserine decarboxylase [Alphaproteobacteria bacterium 40-19]|nr:MAG: phosphatidylserine decarboxylase [Alphaproteobacteria bacterium 40-19]